MFFLFVHELGVSAVAASVAYVAVLVSVVSDLASSVAAGFSAGASAAGASATGYLGVQSEGFVYCYSFALKPEEHQPSGTCNFSRVDNAELVVTPADGVSTITVFAHGYNVLRVASGMGGLAYSN